MRVKPTEIRLVASLLESPAEDAEDLARQIIEALDAKRTKDNEQWVAVYQWAPENHLVTLACGPHPTKSAAEREVKKMVSPSLPAAKAMVLPLRPWNDTPRSSRAKA